MLLFSDFVWSDYSGPRTLTPTSHESWGQEQDASQRLPAAAGDGPRGRQSLWGPGWRSPLRVCRLRTRVGVPDRDPAERQDPSPQGHGEGGWFLSGPRRYGRSGRRMWSLWAGGLPPQLCAWAKGVSLGQALLTWLGRVARSCRCGTHTPPTAGRPKSYFRRLVETRPVWPDRGTAPPTGSSLPGLPDPASHSDSRPCGAAGRLSAGEPKSSAPPAPAARGPRARPYREPAGSQAWGTSFSPAAPPYLPT